MATVTRRCKGETCRRRFRVSSQSRRLFCEACRPPRVKAGELVDEPKVAHLGLTGPIESALLAELAAVGREATVEGLVALGVARDLDTGVVPPAQRPTVGQKLGALKDAALRGTVAPNAVANPLDELTARRAAKAAAAS